MTNKTSGNVGIYNMAAEVGSIGYCATIYGGPADESLLAFVLNFNFFNHLINLPPQRKYLIEMSKIFKIICCIATAVFLSAGSFDFSKRATPLPINYPDYFGNRFTIPADNPTTEQGVYLGRLLFYETLLSANNTVSCATCHQQKLAFTDGKQFSTGFDGTLQPRNTMSLANLLWVRNFFWDGRENSLEKQGAIPLTGAHEMGQLLDTSANKLRATKKYILHFRQAFDSDSITGDKILKALAQFQRTLISAGSRYDKFLNGRYNPTASELNGLRLFYTDPNPAGNIRGANCGHCHSGPKTFMEVFHNNGLDSLPNDPGRGIITGRTNDRGRFRVVTLRNIALTAPYMHDGRFNTLEQVVSHYNEHINKSSELSAFLQNNSNTVNGTRLDLTVQEKKDLVAFLHMLTDSSFIADKRFSNPF